MSNYNSLKATIDANIKQNGNQEITGQILNSVLNAMVTTLGTGYQFAGVATIATNPGTPDAKVFYIANGKGTYEKFGGLEVTEDDVVVLYWDSAWHKVATGIASQEKLSELDQQMYGDRLTIKTSFEGKPDEHPADKDRIAIDGNVGGKYKVKLDVGTALCDGQQVRLRAFKNGSVVYAMYVEGASQAEYSLPIVLGQEIEFTLAREVDEFGFYIYKITQAGTFDVSIIREATTAAIVPDVERLKVDVDKLNEDVEEIKVNLPISNTFIFNVTSSEHSSGLDHMPYVGKAGELLRFRLDAVTGKCNNSNVNVYSFYNGSGVYAMLPIGGSQGENVLSINIGEDVVFQLTSDIDELSVYLHKVTTLGTFAMSVERLDKSYIQMDYTDRLVQSKLKRTNDNATLSLLHFSDIHSDKERFRRISSFARKYRHLIDEVICSGDVVYNYADEAEAENRGFSYWSMYRTDKNKILLSIGNHDIEKSDGGSLTESECRTKYYTPFSASNQAYASVVFGGDDVCYYYKDYTSHKVRVIVLDWGHQTETQKTWFIDTLSSAKTLGYAVVVVNHCPFAWQYMTKQKNRFDALLNFGANNQILSIDYARLVDNFINDGGKFVCWLAGHTHVDYFSVLENFNNQVMVNVGCATILQSAKDSDIWRLANTQSEDLFNIVTINTSRGTFSLIRVGADIDTLQRSRKSITWDYINHKLIAEE